MNQSLKASKLKLEKAKQFIYNKKLKKTNITYLKLLEKWKPNQYKDLYNETVKLMNEYDDVFAKFTCDRRTLNVAPRNLGIKPEYKNSHIRTEQYQLNSEKRIEMIGYTTECDKNGFWITTN